MFLHLHDFTFSCMLLHGTFCDCIQDMLPMLIASEAGRFQEGPKFLNPPTLPGGEGADAQLPGASESESFPPPLLVFSPVPPTERCEDV